MENITVLNGDVPRVFMEISVIVDSVKNIDLCLEVPCSSKLLNSDLFPICMSSTSGEADVSDDF